MRPAFVIATVLAGSIGVATPARSGTESTAVFAGGCFWGVEWVFEHVKGVIDVESGYAGGTTKNPTYTQVGSGRTGHAETVRIVYDPDVVSYRQLLEVFFMVAHDPTTRDRQGPDVGSDYRAIVFAQDTAQRRQVDAYIAELTRQRVFRKPIVTEVRGAEPFYHAEEYHQDYASLHPGQLYIVINDVPKLRNLKRLFPSLYTP